ncbi:pyocin knob domain-containing S74 family peptidase [Ensifer sp. NPDC090286]|uniref:pyocin knob domain-containing S74 family peptidase n=1 Tax=Ensifer sp. NPDC090286 TaxID=3363991 RepID=UPI00383B2FE2
MALPSHYSVGTATVAANSNAVTGQGTSWLNSVQPGDLFGTHKGSGVRILSVNSNTSLTLAYPWPAAAQTAAGYEIQITPDTARMDQATRDLLELLKNGNLDTFAALVSAADRLPYFSGAGATSLAVFTEFARSLLDDANGAAAYATLGEIPNGQTPDRLKSTAVLLTDANDANGSGMFYVNGASLNIPEGAQGSVFQIQGSSSTKTQIYHRNSNGNLWSRTMVGGVWTGWQRSISANSDGAVPAAVRIAESTAIPALSSATMLTLQKVTHVLLQMVGGNPGTSSIYFGDATTNHKGSIVYLNDVNRMRFSTAATISLEIFDDGTLRSVPSYNATSASAANMFIASNGAIVRSTSSAQYKTQVEDLWPNYADAILQMRPVWYRSLCAMDNPDWSYIGLIAEEVGAIEPRLVHWRTEEIVTETVEKQVTVSVERPVEREAQVTRTEYVDTGLLDDDGKPLFRAFERTETIVEIDMVTVEEVQTIAETEHRSVPLPEPVAEGIMYDRLVVHLIAHAQRQHAKIETLTTQMADLLIRVGALEAAASPTPPAQ